MTGKLKIYLKYTIEDLRENVCLGTLNRFVRTFSFYLPFIIYL